MHTFRAGAIAHLPLLLAGALLLPHPGVAQLAHRNEPVAAPQPAQPSHRTRLILKDGTYQVVTSYAIHGDRVRYLSAERGGEPEELPLALVDLPATRKWEQDHKPRDPDAPPGSDRRPAPAIDPELLREEAARAELSPEVAPNLRLAPENSLLGLDTFRSTPDLVPLTQSQGETARHAGHNVLKGLVNPASASHSVVVIKGERADVQFHVSEPVFYIKLDDELPPSGAALTVDTHGASTQASKQKLPQNDYVIVRVDVRTNARVVDSFNISQLNTGKRQSDLVETNPAVLPGGHWLKLTPQEPLLIGEYALVEVLDARSINLGVWDFGIHPQAPENRDLIAPEKRRPASLSSRPPE